MAACSEIASCLSEGATVCILTSGTCPPCVYALSGGDFSCYSRDTSGDCPFSGAYAECDKASSSTSTASNKTSTGSGEGSGNSNNDTPALATKTKAPAKTTVTPTATTAPTTSASETSSSTGGNTNETPTTDATTAPSTDATTTPSTDATTTPSTDATTTPSATTASSSSSENQTTQTASSSSNDSSAEKALTSNTASTTGSPAVVNLALIGGAVVLVVIVIAFVARRVVKKKKMYHTQEHTVSSQNSAWSDRTLGTGASGGNLYSTYSYKDEAGKGNGISMLSDSQASSTYGPGYDQSMNSGSSPRSKADFSNYGGDSQYATESQYYNDYSVSTGPELLAAGAAAGQQPYANNTLPPSARGNNNFVDATSMANRESSFGSVRQHPLTVSQLMPTAIEEDEEQAYASRRPAPLQYQTAVPPVPPSTRKPQIFAASTASSMRSDYDIVDPITMRDVEARNTEMLAEDSRYPKFSFESETASDVYDGSSSEEESDDERVRHGEHTI